MDNNLLSEYPIPKAIAKIGIPAMASMLIMSIYNLVDTYFIGMLNDDRALSAVAVAFPIMSLIGAVGQVLGAGSAATVGRAFGAGDEEYASRVSSTIIFTSILSGFVFMIIGLVFIEPIFRLFGTTDSVMPDAISYGTWMYIGSIFSIPKQVFNNLARAETKAMLSMKALSIGAISNIILDPFFMFELGGFGLNMGIEGASIATALAQGLGCTYIAWHFFGGKTRVKAKFRYFKPKLLMYNEVLRSGAPVGVTNMLSTVAVSVTNIAAIMFSANIIFGENIQSAYGIVLKINMVLLCVVMGVLLGYQPLASFAYGAKNKERFFECMKFMIKLILGIAVPVTLILQIFATQVMSAFTKNPEIIEMGALFIRMNTIFLVLMAISTFITITLQATGNGKYGTIIASARQGYLYIPMLFLGCYMFSSSVIFYIQPISDLLTAIIAIAIFIKYKKELEIYFKDFD